MAKTYTDLEQSKKLAEILPVESADMWFHPYPNDEYWYDVPNIGNADLKYNQLPCWSLASLLQIMPHCIDDRYDLVLGKLSDNKGWYVMYDDIDHFVFLYIAKSNLIDACVEMILELHEEKLL